jgi:MFS transporter, FSR family, fosmidomycin resistance protein
LAVTPAVEAQTAEALVALPVPAVAETAAEAQARQRNWVMGIVTASHTINHINGNTLPLVLGVMMTSFGLSYTDLGLLQTVNSLVSNAMQASYGFICQYIKRSVVLGIGNIVMGISTMLMGGTTSFGPMVGLRGLNGAGSSPQHPVGSTMLATYFPKARGRALALHSTAGNLGQAIAPVLAATLIYFFDWRVAFFVVGVPSIIVGLSFLWLRDRVQVASGSGKRARAGWQAYKACFKNRDLMLVSCLLMVGAAGRDGGITQVYFVPHFMRDLGVAAAVAASLLTLTQVGGMLGPLGIGWLSDIFPRKLVLQLSLLLSAISTLWLGHQFALTFLLLVNLFLQGAVTFSRQTITQAMVIDYTEEQYHDAAFSLYYTIGFISGPAWNLAMGALMQTLGFTAATHVMAASYLIGMLILIPVRLGPASAPIGKSF